MQYTKFDFGVGEGIRFRSIGRCIYCGTEDSELTDEHILPYALTGNGLIFEKASCLECADEIKRYEQPCLRSTFMPMRFLLDSPSRRKKHRPTHAPVIFQRVDSNQNDIGHPVRMQFPIKELPAVLPCWKLPEPGILLGKLASDEILGKAWVILSSESYRRCADAFAKKYNYTGTVNVVMPEIDGEQYLRFLAKTAHALSVSQFGFSEDNKFLVDLILNRSRHLCHYIGCDQYRPPPDPGSIFSFGPGEYFSRHHPDKIFRSIRFRFFPLFNGLVYTAVTGFRNLSHKEKNALNSRNPESMMNLLMPDDFVSPVDMYRVAGGRKR